jgi:peptidoglycan/LPS O-acetylase OafA/YrhL
MESKPRARPDFRSDINCLRAWAVVAVILYHFDVPGFGGGFVGVDVFFVISGFLMTGIVVDGLERGEFSLLAFYLARASCILPALIVLCTVLLMLAGGCCCRSTTRNWALMRYLALPFFPTSSYGGNGIL